MRNTYRIVAGISEGKGQRGAPRLRWNDNTKTDDNIKWLVLAEWQQFDSLQKQEFLPRNVQMDLSQTYPLQCRRVLLTSDEAVEPEAAHSLPPRTILLSLCLKTSLQVLWHKDIRTTLFLWLVYFIYIIKIIRKGTSINTNIYAITSIFILNLIFRFFLKCKHNNFQKTDKYVKLGFL
jgi:hypothetical protein